METERKGSSAAQGGRVAGKHFQEVVITKLKTEECTRIQQMKDCLTGAHRGNRIYKDPEIKKHGMCLGTKCLLYMSW